MRNLRRLSRETRGSVMIELAASVFVLLIFFVGIAYYTALSVDARREGRSIRSALEMVIQLDVETSAPSQDDVDAVARAAAVSLKATPDDDIQFTATVAEQGPSGETVIGWTRTFGGYADAQPSRIAAETAGVRVSGVLHDLDADERLVIVELFRNGRGIGSQRGDNIYKAGVAYRTVLPASP